MAGVVGFRVCLFRKAQRVTKSIVSRIHWKVWQDRVTAPYAKMIDLLSEHPSTAEHEKFCGNLRGPSRKAKYYLTTDSVPVP